MAAGMMNHEWQSRPADEITGKYRMRIYGPLQVFRSMI